MPYANEIIGVYRIFNRVSGKQYIGQSRRVKKRIADHFCLLRQGKHPNQYLQRSFKKYGESAFGWELEVCCEDPADLDSIELAALNGDLEFNGTDELYNIALQSPKGMLGRRHTEESKRKMSLGNMGKKASADLRRRLSEIHTKRLLADPEFKSKIDFILARADLSYAERARQINSDTSSVRRLYLRYSRK